MRNPDILDEPTGDTGLPLRDITSQELEEWERIFGTQLTSSVQE